METGALLGGYRIVAEPLLGGMGVIAAARPETGGAQVALKVLDSALAARPDMRARIDSAMPLFRDPGHPGVLPVLEAGEWEGRPFVAVPWVDALDLRSVVRVAGPLSVAAVARVTRAVGEALDALDGRGLAYADVKPGNVLLTRDTSHLDDVPGGIGLAHSWLAWAHDGPRDRYAEPGEFAATINYVAPELIGGSLGGLASDMYSLGCLVFECLVGVPPFVRETEDETLEAHLHSGPPSLEPAGIGKPVEEAVHRALAKDPAERYPTASDFAEALASAVE